MKFKYLTNLVRSAGSFLLSKRLSSIHKSSVNRSKWVFFMMMGRVVKTNPKLTPVPKPFVVDWKLFASNYKVHAHADLHALQRQKGAIYDASKGARSKEVVKKEK